jgi:hypothetical protein
LPRERIFVGTYTGYYNHPLLEGEGLDGGGLPLREMNGMEVGLSKGEGVYRKLCRIV